MNDAEGSPWADPLPDDDEDFHVDREQERYAALMSRLHSIESAIRTKPAGGSLTIGDGIRIGVGMFIVLPILIIIAFMLFPMLGLGLRGLLR